MGCQNAIGRGRLPRHAGRAVHPAEPHSETAQPTCLYARADWRFAYARLLDDEFYAGDRDPAHRNRVSGRTLYRWHVLSKDGLPVPASNGIVVSAEASLAEAGRYAHLIVVADNEVRHDDDRAVFAQLRRLARGGMSLGAINLGTYLLARAGLLDGYRCTVHWENLSGFVEMFPHLEVTSKLFEVDRDRFTCSGGIAALDMMLHVIAVQHGTALAKSASERCPTGLSICARAALNWAPNDY